MNNVRKPEDLIVYRKAYKLGLDVIQICSYFPRADKAKILKTQLIRASTSIAANIAEGYGGNRKGTSYENYLTIARRSTTETQTWLRFCYDCKFIKEKEFNRLYNECKEIIAILTVIIRKIR